MKQKILALIKAPTFVASVLGGLTTIGGVLVSYHFVSNDLESAVFQISAVVFPPSIALAAILLSGKKQQAAATLEHAEATRQLSMATRESGKLRAAATLQSSAKRPVKAAVRVRKASTTPKGQS